MANNVQTTTITIGGSVSKSLQDALSFANDGIKRIGTEMTLLDRRLARLSTTSKEYARMRTQVDALRASQEALERIEAKRTANLEKREKLGSAFGEARGALGTAVTALAKPVENASGFARQNQQIGVAANLSRAQVSALGRAILEQSRTTNQGADALQRSIKLMIDAGMDAQSAQASLGAVGRTTTVTGASIDDVAQAAAALQQSFDIDPSRMQNALDVLVVNSRQGGLGLKDMAEVLPALGSSFEAMKLQGTSAAATLGAALQATLDSAGGADKAASNMKSFMSSVLSPELQNKAKKSLNLDLRKIIGDAQTDGGNPFDAAMQGIIQATAGDQKKIGALFGDAQAKNFVQPMIENWDSYIRIRDTALNGSSGTTDAAYVDAMQTDPQKIEGAKIAVDNLSKAFGAALLPAVGEAAVKLTELLNGVTSFVQENPKLIANTTQIVVGMLGMRTAVLGARYAWTFLQGPILAVQKACELFRGGSLLAQMGRFGPMAMRLASGFRIVATAVGAIGGGPIALAVAAITAGALLVRKYWEPIKAFLGGVWEGLSGAGTAAMGELMRAVEPLRPAWEVMSGLIGQAWDWLSRMLAPAQYTGNELSRVAQIGSFLGTVLMEGLRMNIQLISGLVQYVVWMGNVYTTVASGIGSVMSMMWTTIKSGAESLFNWLVQKLDFLMPYVVKLMGFVEGGIGKVSALVGKGLDFGKEVLTGSAEAIGNGMIGYTNMRAGGRGGLDDAAGLVGDVATLDGPGAGKRWAGISEATRGRTAPEMPSPSPRGVTTVQQQQTNNITIHQQPGESSESVARRTADELQRRNAVAARGGLADRN
ncbi:MULTISPECIES: phage tail tape measure protein [Stenotrophomonas]|uniref:phage tail tape measure protein n=1 Tax=Stenotrophomonas TaxID=40323 RepID=UPI000FF9BABC|nr:MULTISPECIES: phage tail tape measure protein [Stenotrophomonas]MBC9080535.1 phage tail tape measure protein [Stenotrophomonas maltophilia]MBC9092632.1 phage tail tape measure protein [Stenotrophomonas maltophilia]MBH1388063.1 phage tail tape measure protein [Stenotrophomonas maltophilia]MBH1521673.1 phage tail tape measure protein [Stenotrophomonas maltophilia]MCF3464115.1 phage tail tape measure protein [Stenotrophomonas maltophilia]